MAREKFSKQRSSTFSCKLRLFQIYLQSSAFSVFTSSSLSDCNVGPHRLHEGFEIRHHGQQQNIFNGFLTYGLWLSHRPTERSRYELDK